MAYIQDNEYGTVLRVSEFTRAPPTHERISATSPPHIVQYCRTMTLAQGRVLYEVWDQNYTQGLVWLTAHVLAYMVPRHIAIEARQLSCRDRNEDWKNLPLLIKGRYEAAWEVVVRDFPGMPIFAARKVVEESMRSGMGWEKEGLEAVVVGYGLRNWTSYLVRLGERSGLSAEREVKGVVAGRLREVLRTWMRAAVGDRESEGLFERQGLLESAVKERVPSRTWFT